MSPGNPLYNELDRLNAELEKSRTMQAILFILWAEANERLKQDLIDPEKLRLVTQVNKKWFHV